MRCTYQAYVPRRSGVRSVLRYACKPSRSSPPSRELNHAKHLGLYTRSSPTKTWRAKL